MVAHGTVLAVLALAAYAALLRCMHLLNPGNYFLLGPDSHFFHWLAQRIMNGEGPPADAPVDAIYTLHSGLAYPLAYVAKAIVYVFDVPAVDALNVACQLVPPLIGVAGVVFIYLVGAKMFDRRAGLFAALAWAILFSAVIATASGRIDREGLSAFFIMAGTLIFYFSAGWSFYIRGKDVGWLMAALGVLAVEGILYVYWAFVGPLLLLAVLVVYFVVWLLLEYADRLDSERSATRRLRLALGQVNWRALAVVLALNALVLAVNPGSASWLNLTSAFVSAGGSIQVEELKGLTFNDLIAFQLFFIPICVGIYVAAKKRSSGAVMVACWFLCLLVLSLLARRVLFFAAPAACLLAGIGLGYLWRWQRLGKCKTLKRIGVTALLLLLVVLSFGLLYPLGSDAILVVNEEWRDALTYIREDTSPDSAVATQWSWGYWILDLGERRPIVDNGYFGYPLDRLHDIGVAYTSYDPAEVAAILDKWDAEYLVFSELDLDFASGILGWAGLDEEYTTFPSDSLYTRSMNAQFESGGGLRVVYRSAPKSEVVILSRTGFAPD